jgi:hypothetical protein
VLNEVLKLIFLNSGKWRVRGGDYHLRFDRGLRPGKVQNKLMTIIINIDIQAFSV